MSAGRILVINVSGSSHFQDCYTPKDNIKVGENTSSL